MICPHCGNNNKEGTTFCGNCGKEMPNITDLFSESDISPKVSKQSPINNTDNTNIKQTDSSVTSNPISTPTASVNDSDILSSPTNQESITNISSANNIKTATKNTFNENNNSISKNHTKPSILPNANSFSGNTTKINKKHTDININFDTPSKKNISRVGFSKVVSSPLFLSKLREYNLKIFIISLFFIPLPIVFLMIYSNFEPDFGTSDAIKYGLLLSALFSFFLLIIYLQRAYGKPWEGVIVYKDVEQRRRKRNKYSYEYYDVYVLKISTDSGSSRTIEEYSQSDYYYSHFNVGDRIKYHPSIGYYEKYDKTNDYELLCPFCSTVTSIEKSQCKKCGTPLIK